MAGKESDLLNELCELIDTAYDDLNGGNFNFGYVQSSAEDALSYGERNLAKVIANALIEKQYYYSFLRAMHELNRASHPEIIITGSSHALYAIDEECFDSKCINLSMHSQDIYYDFLNAKKAIQVPCSKVNTCVIIMGYYIIGQDLSKQTRFGHMMIDSVYYSLFHDTHNWHDYSGEDIWEKIKINSRFRDPSSAKKAIIDYLTFWFEKEPSYFNKHKLRKGSIANTESIAWDELSNAQRDTLAKQRAEIHNKILKHDEAVRENQLLMREYTTFLLQNGIRPIIVITPFTPEYNKYVFDEYKESIFDTIKSLDENVTFMDFNDINTYSWDSSDFVDTDHMSEKGARKFSKILNKKILEM